MLMRWCSTTARGREQASGRLTVQKASGTSRAPSIRWKALAAPTPLFRGKPLRPPHAAAIQFLGRQPDPPKSGSSFLLRPGQDARPSSERLEILYSHLIAVSIWSNRRNRGTI